MKLEEQARLEQAQKEAEENALKQQVVNEEPKPEVAAEETVAQQEQP